MIQGVNGGEYDYHLVNLQIHRLLGSIDDPVRKMKWQQIQGEVNIAQC